MAGQESGRNTFLDLGPKVLRLNGLGLDFGVDHGAKVLVLKVAEGQGLSSKGVTVGQSKASTEIDGIGESG
jgi:hypothetical protein